MSDSLKSLVMKKAEFDGVPIGIEDEGAWENARLRPLIERLCEELEYLAFVVTALDCIDYSGKDGTARVDHVSLLKLQERARLARFKEDMK